MLIMNASTPKKQQQHFPIGLSLKKYRDVFAHSLVFFYFLYVVPFSEFSMNIAFIWKQTLESICRQSKEGSLNSFIIFNAFDAVYLAFF